MDKLTPGIVEIRFAPQDVPFDSPLAGRVGVRKKVKLAPYKPPVNLQQRLQNIVAGRQEQSKLNALATDAEFTDIEE